MDNTLTGRWKSSFALDMGLDAEHLIDFSVLSCGVRPEIEAEKLFYWSSSTELKVNKNH